MTSFIQSATDCDYGCQPSRISQDVPYFGGLSPESRLGSSLTQNVPHFREAKVKIFGCDATPIYIKFHPQSLKLMCMGREH